MENVADRSTPRRTRGIVASIILIGGIVPVLLYWLALGHVATVAPPEALQRLREHGDATALVDVRSAERFAAGHIDGSVGWPMAEILASTRADLVPDALRGKTLLLICEVGYDSSVAARHLSAVNVAGVHHVRGGIQEWIRAVAGELGRRSKAQGPFLPDDRPPAGQLFERWRTSGGDVVELPFRRSTLPKQALAVAAFFMIKPVYTLLSLGLVVVLWRSRAPDLVALRWGMIFFFLGENACAANYFVFKETSYVSEYLHSLGMLCCFGFVVYAILEGIDRRMLWLGDPQCRCAALGLCGRCIKHADVPCGLQRTFYVILAGLMVLALMLPTADWQDASYNTVILGQLYNYSHPRVYQLLENWYCAAAAVTLFAVSLGILVVRGRRGIATAKIALAAGAGPLAFGMLRMVIGGVYNENRVWYLVWEEGTELLFIAAIGCLLWIFRRGLLPPAGVPEGTPPTP